MDIKKATLIMSGKGGVGKSMVCSQLAIALAKQGRKVGVLDVDICGPSQARMLLCENNEEVLQTDEGWQPVRVHKELSLYLMSISFLTTKKDSAIIWRGPKKHSMIERFISGVAWKDLDHLIIDTPPGTSDEHISLVEILRSHKIPAGVILVTTPQLISCDDVRRQIKFCKVSGMPIIGMIENMRGFACPNCKESFNILSSEGGEKLCRLAEINYLGSLPFVPELTSVCDTGADLMTKQHRTSELFERLASKAETATLETTSVQ